jgi:hypothetical protein
MSSDPPDSWEKLKVLSVAISSIAIPIVVAVVGSTFSKDQREKEIGVRYVELAIQLLRATPDAESKALRTWAIKVVDHYSEVPLPEDAKQELEFRQIKIDIQKLGESQLELSKRLEDADSAAKKAIESIKQRGK